MRARTRRLLIQGTVVAALAAVIALAWLHRGTVPVQEGRPAPDFRAAGLRGDTVVLSSLRGRVVVLNIWATWCPPCRWEMPALQRLYERLGPRGLAVVAVSEDEAPAPGAAYGGTLGEVPGFVRDNGLTFTVLLDPRGSLQRLYGLAGLPTTFIIDRRGRIVRRVLGPARWDEPPYSAEIERLLEG